MTSEVAEVLEVCRQAEVDQALFYGALAEQARGRGDDGLGERFGQLRSDELRHLAWLTARLRELGGQPAGLDHVRGQRVPVENWQVLVRRRERDEIRRYQIFLAQELDPATRALVGRILEEEMHHSDVLGGEWKMV